MRAICDSIVRSQLRLDTRFVSGCVTVRPPHAGESARSSAGLFDRGVSSRKDRSAGSGHLPAAGELPRALFVGDGSAAANAALAAASDAATSRIRFRGHPRTDVPQLIKTADLVIMSRTGRASVWRPSKAWQRTNPYWRPMFPDCAK